MAGVKGMAWSTRELSDVASAVDDLTKQLMIANQMKAADILHQQNVISTGAYCEFLWDVYQQE